jgi:2-polyprenyl-6-methoxyphenol hydroxylase-like FAD-dependent oxidoreductase
MHVLVIGGGIGGLCLAQGLRRNGVGVAVYERDAHRDDRVDRYRLAINPAGSRALHHCLPDAQWQTFLRTAGKRGGGLAFLDSRLGELVVVEDALMYPPKQDPAEADYPVDRATLRRILLDGLDDAVHFGKSFQRYEIGANGRPTAFFADGTRATGDVLVGADGVHSRVRGQYLPGAKQRDVGAVGIGLKLPLNDETRALLPPRLATGMNLVLSGRPTFLFTSVFEREPARPDDYLLCAFVARSDQVPANAAKSTGGELKALVQGLTADWHPHLRKVIEACPADTVATFPFLAAERPAPWKPSRVTVLGDAIHAMPPAGGNGANTALRDAYKLSQELAQAGGDPVRAIGRYEDELRDHGFEAVGLALETLRQGLDTDPFTPFGPRLWFRLCAAIPALRRMTFQDSWAKVTRHRPWELAA